MSPDERKALWLRLRRYQFDDLVPPQLRDRILHMFGGADASLYAFASKLSRKLGWKRTFALRAIAEYRKFVYLGVTSPFPVTPPKIVDQVWHEHLLFTHAYGLFCTDVLGTRFDHYPELVPAEDQTGTFQAQYVKTLDLYAHEFNRPAPDDIWGTPKFRRVRDDTPVQVEGFLPGDGPPLHDMVSSFSVHGELDGFHGGASGGGGASAGWSDAASDGGGHAAGDSGVDGGGAGGGSDGGSAGCSSSSGCSSSGCGGGGGGD